jgi:glycosyltransferase involved in cell wall biosynthesis
MGTDQKINVCHLISGDLWAGAEVQAYGLLCSLKSVPDLGLSAIVLNEGKLSAALRKAGIEVKVIEESKYGFFKILSLISDELKDKDINILHTHRYKENVLGALLKRKCRVKRLVQTVHGINEPFIGIKKLKIELYSWLNKYYTRNYFDKVMAVSFNIGEKLKRGLDTDKIDVIHNAVDLSDTGPIGSLQKIREELNIEKGQPVIGTAGRMVPIKGYDILLEAAAIILRKKHGVRFLLAGDGPLKTELEGKAKEIGLEQEVMFLGFRDDIKDVIHSFDIFVISSYHEGMPMILLEAMAMRKAVVATNVGGINEIIEDNVSGLLVRPGDAQGLASACLIVLEDFDMRIRMGVAARKRIEKEFSIEIHTKRVLKAYNELMD